VCVCVKATRFTAWKLIRILRLDSEFDAIVVAAVRNVRGGRRHCTGTETSL
jgi:hypothetical protein